jgi:hypothetical protein
MKSTQNYYIIIVEQVAVVAEYKQKQWRYLDNVRFETRRTFRNKKESLKEKIRA